MVFREYGIISDEFKIAISHNQDLTWRLLYDGVVNKRDFPIFHEDIESDRKILSIVLTKFHCGNFYFIPGIIKIIVDYALP
jgi:hypothetical protein